MSSSRNIWIYTEIHYYNVK